MVKPFSPERISTGVAGLDQILGGGLPRKHVYLVQGTPGTGKTTLALQFLRAGVTANEKVLLVTFAESAQQLHEIARSHGWSLDGIELLEMAGGPVPDQDPAAQTIFHSSEVELTEVADDIIQFVRQFRPDRVVLDSITEIRLMAANPYRYRQQILQLRQVLQDLDSTVILTSDLPPESSEETLHSLVHGVVQLQQELPPYGTMRRKLYVRKVRGISFHEGFHDFRIQTGGIEVYPRLKIEKGPTRITEENVTSGVAELDRLIGGGLLHGTACLIAGASGTGKSTLATLYAHTAASRGDRVAIFIFEERLSTFYLRAAQLGLDMRPFVESGHLIVKHYETGDIAPGEFAHVAREIVEQDEVSLVVIDSLSGYWNAIPNRQLVQIQMHELLSYLGQQGVLTLMIVTQHGIVGQNIHDPVDLSYLADTVILLRHFEAGGSIRQAISVIKKRHGNHERTIREMHITSKGVEVGPPLATFQGVLTGSPTFTGDRTDLLGPSQRPEE